MLSYKLPFVSRRLLGESEAIRLRSNPLQRGCDDRQCEEAAGPVLVLPLCNLWAAEKIGFRLAKGVRVGQEQNALKQRMQ